MVKRLLRERGPQKLRETLHARRSHGKCKLHVNEHYFLLSHSTKVLKFQLMRVTKILSIPIQRKQRLIVILTLNSHQNKKSINSIVACLMVSLMICHFVFVIFEVVYDQSGRSITS